jgi:hypothetical protein
MPLSSRRAPDLRTLTAQLAAELGGPMTVLERRRKVQSSTFPSEVLTCCLAQGRTLRLLCKHGRAPDDEVYGPKGGWSTGSRSTAGCSNPCGGKSPCPGVAPQRRIRAAAGRASSWCTRTGPAESRHARLRRSGRADLLSRLDGRCGLHGAGGVRRRSAPAPRPLPPPGGGGTSRRWGGRRSRLPLAPWRCRRGAWPPAQLPCSPSVRGLWWRGARRAARAVAVFDAAASHLGLLWCDCPAGPERTTRSAGGFGGGSSCG